LFIMSIEQDLRAKLTEAIRAKDRRTADTIRMINTKVMERRTGKGFKGEVDDALFVDVIGAYRKSLDKARAEYDAAGDRGTEQSEALAWEIAFCDQFLPAQLSDDEIRAAVDAAIAELGAADPKMAGRVLGAVMKQHKGRVEAGRVKPIVDAALGGA
jgi:uncharacterized protein YqeY